jgi:beta-aspartyl-dipeptidase (metallo-type)
MLTQLIHAEVCAPEALGKKQILVAGSKVVAVTDEPVSITGVDVETIDLEGRLLIPGLLDCHVHLTGGGGEAGFRSQVPPLSLGAITRGGTTTVVGVTGTDDSTRSTSALLAATRGLREQGLSAYCLTGGYHLPPTTFTGSVRDDLVHLGPVIGVGEVALSDHRSSQPTLDELLRVAADAHVGGMLSGKAGLTHLHLGDGRRGLELLEQALKRSELPPRVFHPTHVNRRRELFDQALELARVGCSVDVTAFPMDEDDSGWSAADAVRRFLESSVPADRLTVSSDAGGSLPEFDRRGRVTGWGVGQPGALGEALAELLEAGIEPARVLPCFTANVARVLGLAEKGRIAPGFDADLVILGADGRATDVMALGRWHVRDGNQRIHGSFEGDTDER